MQPKKPRFNPLVIAIVLAAVLMVWSVLGGTGGNANGSSMAYSTVVHYFESNQVTKFSLDLNTSLRAGCFPACCPPLPLPPPG